MTLTKNEIERLKSHIARLAYGSSGLSADDRADYAHLIHKMELAADPPPPTPPVRVPDGPVTACVVLTEVSVDRDDHGPLRDRDYTIEPGRHGWVNATLRVRLPANEVPGLGRLFEATQRDGFVGLVYMLKASR